MKMKKRIITGAVAMMMAGVMMIPVQATEITESGPDTGTTNVIYTEPNKYTISIPQTVTLKNNNVEKAEIAATNVNLAPNSKINVKMTNGVDESGNVTLERTDDETTKITAKITEDEAGQKAYTKNTVFEFTGIEEKTVYFQNPVSTDANIKAGTYNGTITFEVSVTTTTSSSN